MKLIADKVTFSIEEEGLYKVQRNVLPDLKFGANGPTYECIELRILDNKASLTNSSGLNVQTLARFTFVEKADIYIGENLDRNRINQTLYLIYLKWRNSGNAPDRIPQQVRFCYHDETHEKAIEGLVTRNNVKYKNDSIQMHWNAEYMKDAIDRPLKVMTVKFEKK